MPDHAKEYAFDVIEFTLRANESCFDEFEFRKTLMTVLKLYCMFTIMQISLLKVYFAAIDCRLAQMNVFSHYCLTFSANDCLFSLNEVQKVYISAFFLQGVFLPQNYIS